MARGIRRTRWYEGFGIALEEYNFEARKWFHVRWLSGPAAAR